MATTINRPSELGDLEQEALSRLDAEGGHLEEDLDAAAAKGGDAVEELEDVERNPLRLAIAVAFPCLAAAVMVGGVFSGVEPRFYAAAAAILGIALAFVARTIRKPVLANAVIAGGLFGIGLLLVVPTGFGNITGLQRAVSVAAASGNVLRPPVPFTPGWHAIAGWLLGIVGFTAAWVAIVVRKPAVSLLLPLPIAAFAGISVPKSQQVASGLAVLGLFAVGLGLLASTQIVGEGDERPPLSFELRKAARSIPLIALITLALFGLSKFNILFPKPAIDPTQQPQKPKAVPLSEVQDRVLFEVDSGITGPWRIGSLDVYDGKDWRLPPFADNRLKAVPKDGIVDRDLTQGVGADFTVRGLGGAVLPGLPNLVGINAKAVLSYDDRNANIRITEGTIEPGLTYTVVAAAIPTVDDLKAITDPLPPSVQQFTEMPGSPIPPAVQTLIDAAPKTSKFEEFDYLRNQILDNVTASGAGAPVSITAAKVQDMVAGSKEASPFEIVAAQAMLARWVGIPSRIGYGFDGGETVDGILQVRPKNGASFVEVYFPKYKWLPIVGVPKKAKAKVGGDPTQQQQNSDIAPSEDIGVQLFLPQIVQPGSIVAEQIRNIILVALPILLLGYLLYLLFPLAQKAYARDRRRGWARKGGPRARVALAYAEWRDVATDYGYRHDVDTPLLFLERFIPDDEHTEFAWLVTRTLWGDLREDIDDAMASNAEELSRSLRRRLAAAQPATLRAVASVSRQSTRYPYAPGTDLRPRKEKKQRVPQPAHA